MDKTLQQLMQYAKEENWEAMDKAIPMVCNNQQIILWALNAGFSNPDASVRDLAISILEKSTYNLSVTEKEKIRRMMEEDENIFVQFRCAFTLFTRGDRGDDVLKKIREATEHEDIKEIASRYLEQA